MADTISPASMMVFTEGSDISHPPQATVSLFETSLENSTDRASSESVYIKDEDDLEGEEKKPTKKRKSWGQELPTPKTNLPPRYAYTLHHDHPSVHFLLTRSPANERKQKMKKNSDALSVSSATVKLLSPLVSESDKR